MSDDYEVGYGKPPKQARFKKGESGNPKGRPKGARNIKTDIKEVLEEQVQVSEGGKVHHVSKQQAILKRTVEQALNGNMRAAELVMKWQAQHLGTDEGIEDAVNLSPDDLATLHRYASQQKAGSTPGDDT